MSWRDLTAYLDWAGLRPVTELEHEKACRGPVAPLSNEYPWGTAAVVQFKGFYAAGPKEGSGEELASNQSNGSTLGGNCVYSERTLYGPVRVGIFAATAVAGDVVSRAAAGASYWGIMELSGNLWERPITVGVAGGRAFTGIHGDGVLTVAGNADEAHWPVNHSEGAGVRGGQWWDGINFARTSARFGSTMHLDRGGTHGGRGARTAP